MGTYYDVTGSVLIDKGVYDEEKDLILQPLMDWFKESSEGCFEVQHHGDKIEIAFGDDTWGSNTYRNIGPYLKESLVTLKNKHPDKVEGEILYVTWGDMFACKIYLNDEQKAEVLTLI